MLIRKDKLDTNADLKKYVDDYAQCQDLFFKDFEVSYKKMTCLGLGES